jgi:hypothetical protein
MPATFHFGSMGGRTGNLRPEVLLRSSEALGYEFTKTKLVEPVVSECNGNSARRRHRFHGCHRVTQTSSIRSI